MKVLVTGAAGFVGSHLTEKCVELGYQVKAFIHYNSKNNWGWLESSPHKNSIEVITGDIRDFDSVSSAMREVDTVFHLAALIGIPYSYVSPLAYIKTNVEGTYNVLQAAKTLETKNVLVTSTSETYGTAQYVPMDEKHPMVGQSPYSASKIGADNLAVSYFRSFGTPVKIVRPFNIYGPRQSARAIIPSVIIQILNGQKKINLGNVDPTRDLTFVKDTVSGFLTIAKHDEFNGEYVNVGMNQEISIRDLVQMIAKIMKVEVEIITDSKRIRAAKSEVERLFCDSTKFCKTTNWKPQYNLEKGLIETIEWLKQNVAFYDESIRIVQGDVADVLEGVKCDVVVANPPYVPDSQPLPKDVANFEPAIALFGGPDGLELPKQFIDAAARLLKTGGLLAIEHTETQGAAIAKLLSADFNQIALHQDLTGRPRWTSAIRGNQ